MLRVAARASGLAAAVDDRQSQENQAPHARAWSPAEVCRHHVATTDSDHDQPMYPNRAKDMTVNGPDQLRVVDITYVANAVGFVYVAVILDAWLRRVVGYAISRSRGQYCRPNDNHGPDRFVHPQQRSHLHRHHQDACDQRQGAPRPQRSRLHQRQGARPARDRLRRRDRCRLAPDLEGQPHLLLG